MKEHLAKAFGGLTKEYFSRQLFFGALIAAFFVFTHIIGGGIGVEDISFFVYALICTFLYPYSRFVYESIIDFIFGNNLFVVPGALLIVTKLITMLVCWGFAVCIAPIGLGYLYWQRTKFEKEQNSAQETEQK